ncbi:hypothetical protein Bhyg_17775, partial [Pseudolycoriella hygida]
MQFISVVLFLFVVFVAHTECQPPSADGISKLQVTPVESQEKHEIDTTKVSEKITLPSTRSARSMPSENTSPLVRLVRSAAPDGTVTINTHRRVQTPN